MEQKYKSVIPMDEYHHKKFYYQLYVKKEKGEIPVGECRTHSSFRG